MIKLIDTAGQEEYERVRKLFYKDANCFILCYDISNRTSFTNILQKWMPELKAIDSWPIPVVLVGKQSAENQLLNESNYTKIFICLVFQQPNPTSGTILASPWFQLKRVKIWPARFMQTGSSKVLPRRISALMTRYTKQYVPQWRVQLLSRRVQTGKTLPLFGAAKHWSTSELLENNFIFHQLRNFTT